VKIRSKEPYWLLRNGILNVYPSLRKNISCDILIVGGGLSGALMAYQFSREGYKCVVIDKRDVATGSTCANTSMVQYEIDEPLHVLVEKLGKGPAMDIYRQCVRAVGKLQEIIHNVKSNCEFDFKQSLHFAHSVQDADGLIKELECRKVAGIDVRWLDKSDVRSRYGIASEGGLLSETAASLDVYKLTHALLKYSVESTDVQVYDHTVLTAVRYEGAKNFVEVETGNIIECNSIIYATGYETHELLRKSIGRLISTYACISEPCQSLPAALEQTIFWNTQDPYFYFRTTHDKRILIGGADENFKDPGRRDALLDEKEEILAEKFGQCIPGIEFIPDFTWAGTFAATSDGLPYVGTHTDFPNSYFILGYGGNGITFSVMSMEILSDAMANRPNKFLKYFRFDRYN
jgi:glycine/D-amino acid oxidase-like deaminating enzyme